MKTICVSIFWCLPSTSASFIAALCSPHLCVRVLPVPKHSENLVAMQDWSLLGSLGCSFGHITLRDINTQRHISDIMDDMWKPGIVKTLEKTFCHQSKLA